MAAILTQRTDVRRQTWTIDESQSIRRTPQVPGDTNRKDMTRHGYEHGGTAPRYWCHRKFRVPNCAKGRSTNRAVSAQRLGVPAGRCPAVSQPALVLIQSQRGPAQRRPSPGRTSDGASRLYTRIFKNGAKAQFPARCGPPDRPFLAAIIQTPQKKNPYFLDRKYGSQRTPDCTASRSLASFQAQTLP